MQFYLFFSKGQKRGVFLPMIHYQGPTSAECVQVKAKSQEHHLGLPDWRPGLSIQILMHFQ